MTAQSNDMQERLKLGLEELGLNLQAEQIEQLWAYMTLIEKWNNVYNLTALRTAEDMLTHHLLDCLSIVPPLDAWWAGQKLIQPKILDVGSGAGLPGLILAICRPHWQIETIDTVGKKAAFMQQVASQLGLKNVRTHHNRVELFAQKNLGAFDAVISRAFASLPLFMQLCEGLLAPTGVYMAMKAKTEESEDMAAFAQKAELLQEQILEVPFLNAERKLLLFRPRQKVELL